MATYTLYQVDAFTNRLFGGNPAAVVPLQHWPETSLLQQLAIENNLSETVFFVPLSAGEADYHIRWFTPALEINLCGHATLAAAFILFEYLAHPHPKLVFHSQSGLLTVTKEGYRYNMDFPSWMPERVTEYPAELSEALGNQEIVGVYKSRDWLVELQDEAAVRNCVPDFTLMKKKFDTLIITAAGKEADFVSRFFAPGAGVDEDPVTGSAHSQLIPFWSEKLGKTQLFARQLSKRGGELWCEQVNKERVTISGACVFYMQGHFNV